LSRVLVPWVSSGCFFPLFFFLGGLVRFSSPPVPAHGPRLRLLLPALLNCFVAAPFLASPVAVLRGLFPGTGPRLPLPGSRRLGSVFLAFLAPHSTAPSPLCGARAASRFIPGFLLPSLRIALCSFGLPRFGVPRFFPAFCAFAGRWFFPAVLFRLGR